MTWPKKCAKCLKESDLKSILSPYGRKTIAVTFGNLQSQYDFGLFQGIERACRRRGLNLLNLICGSIDSTQPYQYEFEYNQMFYMLSGRNVDGVIILPSIINNYAVKDRLSEILGRFEGIPVVSISVAVPGYPCVLIDNVTGIRTLVTHLYRDHGRRRIAFLSGPENNSEAQDRLSGYFAGIEDCGITSDDRYIYCGNFRYSGGAEGIRYLFSGAFTPPDAIIYANDLSAQGAYEALTQLGLSIPDDVAVSGFDNMSNTEFLNPPLTSVEQDFELISENAVDLMVRALGGDRSTAAVTLSTRIIYRRSTGCTTELCRHDDAQRAEKAEPDMHDYRQIGEWIKNAEDGLMDDTLDVRMIAAKFSDLLFHCIGDVPPKEFWLRLFGDFKNELFSKIKDSARHKKVMDFLLLIQSAIAEINSLQIGLSVVDKNTFIMRQSVVIQRLSSVFNMEDFEHTLAKELPDLGVRTFFFNVYTKPYTHHFTDEWTRPGKSRLLFGYIDARKFTPSRGALRFSSDHVLPAGIGFDGDTQAFVVVGIFFRETQYGYFVYKAGIDYPQMYQDMAIQIAGTYHRILMLEENDQKTAKLHKALLDLKKSNRLLNDMSTRDALTKLFNRRGFVLLGEKYHDLARRTRKGYLLFFADVDGLKSINDTYGHLEGDNIIMACAEVLRKTFRKSDIIARLGGDEFTILSMNAGKEFVKNIHARLKREIGSFNAASGKQYKLSISIGEVSLDDNPTLDFTQMMQKADCVLYERKRAKKRPHLRMRNRVEAGNDQAQ